MSYPSSYKEVMGTLGDVIVTWPHGCDYPKWRALLTHDRDWFGKVFVAFTPDNSGADYRGFVRRVLADVEFIDTRWEDGAEWRDAAVNAALAASNAEWIWFTEPDFFVLDSWFYEEVDIRQRHFDVLGLRMGEDRWHPCSLFVAREWIERTSRYFGPEPIDHFARFGQELKAAGARIGNLDKLLGNYRGTYQHMQGLSHNHHLVQRGQPVTFKPDEFGQYLRECLAGSIEIDPRWVAEAMVFLGGYVQDAATRREETMNFIRRTAQRDFSG